MSERPPLEAGSQPRRHWLGLPNHWFTLGLLLVVWGVIFLPGLGSLGLTNSEGHRAVPGYELAAKLLSDTRTTASDWLVPTMFDREYLRKPPGMTWLVALSSLVFGPSEFAARIVSAVSILCAALVSAWWAGRWFGRAGSLAGGFGVLLMPVLWIHGRTAELEAPMFSATLVACLCAVHLLTTHCAHNVVRERMMASAGLFVGLAALLFIKGPAGLPALGGVVVGSVLVNSGWRELVQRWFMVPVLAGFACFGLYLLAASRLMGPDAITQSPGEFLWSLDRLGGIATLVPAALLMGLPVTLALLFPFGSDAAGEEHAQDQQVWKRARLLALSTLVAAGLLVVAGVSNSRYALPVLVFAPALCGYVISGVCARTMTPQRERIARWMLLGRGWVMGTVLIGGGIAYWGILEQRLSSESGREVGEQIAMLVPTGSQVLADHVIEARPEVPDELERGGAVVRWRPLGVDPLAEAEESFAGSWLLVRSDEQSDELRAHGQGREIAGRWRVHEFEFVLLKPLR